jgi:hypothetical protein
MAMEMPQRLSTIAGQKGGAIASILRTVARISIKHCVGSDKKWKQKKSRAPTAADP